MKQDIRKQLETGIAVFLSQGGEIKKVAFQKPKEKRSYQPKEQVIEIEIDFLPRALQAKYFKE